MSTISDALLREIVAKARQTSNSTVRLQAQEADAICSELLAFRVASRARRLLESASSASPALTSFTDALNRVPAREEHYALTELEKAGHELVRAMGVKP